MPSTDSTDPIVAALKKVLGVQEVKSKGMTDRKGYYLLVPVMVVAVVVITCTVFDGHQGLDLIDSRWNGNEVFKYETDKGLYFIKLNRVEDPSVFLTEAVGLTAIAKTQTIDCPKPLHLGRLPKVR